MNWKRLFPEIIITTLFLVLLIGAAGASCVINTTTNGLYTIAVFNYTGNCTWTATGVTSVEYLVVGGGGAGGSGQGAGGGGGGGFLNGTTAVIAGNTYTITVGSGGLGVAGANAHGQNGTFSAFNTIIAYGGGGGSRAVGAGFSNGTGGGGGLTTLGGSGISGQGFAGGNGYVDTSSGARGGGGGGSGQAGVNGGISSGGTGGNGNISLIIGASTYYGGGGGGGTNIGGHGAAGGLGGGGAGGYDYGVDNGIPGTNDLGGGGGGSSNYPEAGGNGGSGIVIIKYLSPTFCVANTTTLGTSIIVKFNYTGTCDWTVPAGVNSVQYLVVGGGGAGGNATGGGNAGGGGGAGGFLNGTAFSVIPSSILNITIGSGGTVSAIGIATSGGNSIFGNLTVNITAIGGGYGGSGFSPSNLNPATGGSGGGAQAVITSISGAAGTNGQGFSGGDNIVSGGKYAAGGGGGGGSAGSAGTSSGGGAGGTGNISLITGTSTYYAGGGGGGTYAPTTPGGSGGSGIGGNGGANGGTRSGTAGVADTGSGGGGGAYPGGFGGAGGSGIVIIRYAGANPSPIVIWNATPLLGNISTTVQFVDSSTGTNITQGGNFYWNVSDGNTSTLRNLSHVFPASGEYSVYSINHSVTDSPGLGTAVTNWSNQSNYITVYSNLTPFFNMAVSGTSGTAGTTRFDINNSQVGSINVDVWNISFGEGIINATVNASHTYPSAGQYSINVSAFNYTLGIYWVNLSNYVTISNAVPTVSWNATPLFGNTLTDIAFVDVSTGTNITSDGNWNWSFAGSTIDTNVSVLRNWTHQFPCTTVDNCYFSVNHSVIDSPGTPWSITNWSNQTNYIRIFQNLTPTITFAQDKTSGEIPLAVTFTATEYGTIKVDTWAWNFGDGNTSSLQNPTNTFPAGQFTVALTATNYTLGTTIITETNLITATNPSPIVSWNGTPALVNLSTSIQFVDTSTGVNLTAFSWLFGDTISSTDRNVSHQYANTGWYTINHSVIDSYDTPWVVTNWSNQTDYIHVVNDSITVNFNATPTSGVIPLSVDFVDVSTGGIAENWTWDFGDTFTSTDRNVTHIYDDAGQYTVKLKVMNDAGEFWSNQTDLVTVSNPAPVVTWNGTPLFGNISTPIVLVDTSAGTNITKFYWDLNDGNTSTLRNLSHVFPSTVEFTYYSINHSATDSDGTPWQVVAWKNESDYLRIFQNLTPTVSFTESAISGVAPTPISFVAAQAGTITIDDYTWTFGDGSSGFGPAPIYIYNNPGLYTVTLTATNYTLGVVVVTKSNYILISNAAPVVDWNATPLVANLSTAVDFVDASTGTNLTEWNWSFGDNTVSSLRNVSHSYLATGYYSINLSVTDSGGTPWQNVSWLNRSEWVHIVNDSVTPDFTSDVTFGTIPFGVQFTDISTGGVEENWTWIFDGYNTSHEQNPVFIYEVSGIFDVDFQVCNDAGCWWENKSSYITATMQAPIVEWNATPNSTSNGTNVDFVDMSTGESLSSFQWLLNDGSAIDTNRNTTHPFVPGLYTINHSTTNAGGTSWLNRSDWVLVKDTPPTIAWNGIPLFGNITTTIQFTDSSIGDNITDYGWDFGDGNTSTTKDPTHMFPAVDEFDYYSVFHNITQAGDASWQNISWLNETNYVRIFKNLTPTIAFTEDKTSGVWPLDVTFTATEYGAIKVDVWAWDFGDGNTSALQNPTNTFPHAGQYTVLLTATNYTMGVTTVTKTDLITVSNAAPIVNWNATPTTASLSIVVDFVDTSTGTNLTIWNWIFNDGNVSGDRNTSHQFPNTGYYSINLSVTDSDNTPWVNISWLNRSDYIHVVNDSVTPDFTANATTGYTPFAVQFIDISTGGVEENWTWIFDGVSTSHDQNPIFTYYSPGIYSVNFSTCNDAGCWWENKSDYISVLRRSVENRWNATPTIANLSTPVLFVDNSTSAGMNLTGWIWLFGDGNISYLRNDSHTFPHTGFYNISHAAIDSVGTPWEVLIWRNRSDWVHIVNDSITPDFTSNETSDIIPFAVQFNDTSTGGVEENWTWIFDGVSTSHDQNPIFIYTVDGIYSVNFSTCNDAGCWWENKSNYITATLPINIDWNATPTTANLSTAVQFVDMSTGPLVSWNWSLGDGNVSSLRDVSHVYPNTGWYTINMSATDTLSQEYWLNQSDYIHIVNDSITPGFTSDTTSGTITFAVQFNDTSTGGVEENWTWVSGGVFASHEQNASIVYSVAGTYEVDFGVCNDAGCWWENKSNYITASSGGGPTPPTALWNATPSSGAAPLSVYFVDMSYGDVPMTYYWDFGDGNLSTAQNPTHIYEFAGTFTVAHNVTNHEGAYYDVLVSGNSSAPYITVTEVTPTPTTPVPPTADFTSDVTYGNISFDVHFVPFYSGDTHFWIFDGNHTSNAASPTFTYTEEGVWTVNHSVSSDGWENKTNYITAFPPAPAPIPTPVPNATQISAVQYKTTAYDYSPFVSLPLVLLLLIIAIAFMILSHLMPNGNDMFAALAVLFSVATLMGGMSVVILNEPTLSTVTNATSNYSYGVGGVAFNISIVNETYAYAPSVSIVSAMWLNAVLLVFVILMVLNVLYVYVRALMAKTEAIETESKKDDYDELEIVYEDQREK